MSTSYLFQLLQVLIQLQIVQDDGNEKTEQDLKRSTKTRVKLCAVKKKAKQKKQHMQSR